VGGWGGGWGGCGFGVLGYFNLEQQLIAFNRRWQGERRRGEGKKEKEENEPPTLQIAAHSCPKVYQGLESEGRENGGKGRERKESHSVWKGESGKEIKKQGAMCEN